MINQLWKTTLTVSVGILSHSHGYMTEWSNWSKKVPSNFAEVSESGYKTLLNRILVDLFVDKVVIFDK